MVEMARNHRLRHNSPTIARTYQTTVTVSRNFFLVFFGMSPDHRRHVVDGFYLDGQIGSMGIREHPPQGSIVTVDYSKGGFQPPEMMKRRLAVVLSPKIASRPHLCTVVPLSLTEPIKIMPYHKRVKIPFALPAEWGDIERWIKGDMVNSVGFHRVDLLRLGKDNQGKRVYQLDVLPPDIFRIVRQCTLHGMGMSALTKHL